MRSFLKHGHQFHLYIYERPSGVPEGVVLLNASEILPVSSVFVYKRYRSYAGFADFFRFKLLFERGGWWVDADTVCLHEFDFPDSYVFSSEGPGDRWVLNNSILKAPAGSPAMQYAWEECRRVNPKEIEWGQCGPALISRTVQKFKLQLYVQAPQVFCPVYYPDWERVLEPGLTWSFDRETRAIHLWNEMWRRRRKSKNASYAPDCLYELLKRQYPE